MVAIKSNGTIYLDVSKIYVNNVVKSIYIITKDGKIEILARYKEVSEVTESFNKICNELKVGKTFIEVK